MLVFGGAFAGKLSGQPGGELFNFNMCIFFKSKDSYKAKWAFLDAVHSTKWCGAPVPVPSSLWGTKTSLVMYNSHQPTWKFMRRFRSFLKRGSITRPLLNICIYLLHWYIYITYIIYMCVCVWLRVCFQYISILNYLKPPRSFTEIRYFPHLMVGPCAPPKLVPASLWASAVNATGVKNPSHLSLYVLMFPFLLPCGILYTPRIFFLFFEFKKMQVNKAFPW